jgi:hypothetical protein
VTAPVSQIFQLGETKNACNSGQIGTLNTHGQLDRSLRDNSLINLAAEDALGAVEQMTAQAHANLTDNYMNGNALDGNNIGYAPQEHIALAMADTVIFNDDSKADVHLKFRAHQADFIKFRARLNELVFGSRHNSQKGGGIAFQADSALELVEQQEFKAFIRMCGAVSADALQGANGAPWDDAKDTWDALHEGDGTAANADHIGHDAGAPAALDATASHYMRPAVPADVPLVNATSAVTSAQLKLQVTDLMHMCFVTYYGDASDAKKAEANQVRDKLHNERKKLDDIDITATSVIPTSIRGSVAPDARAGIQCTTSLGYASSDDIYNGIHANLKIANLPGADAILVVFNEFLHLMRPFRNNKALRNLANTLFMGSLYRTTRANMTTYLNDPRILNGNNKRWVRYVVEYMKHRILTSRDDGGGLPGGYTLRVDGTDLGGDCNVIFNGVGALRTVNNPHSNAQFVERMRELIALSYCNPFLVVEELIPQALQNNRSNIYLSIASLPNMTRGLKIRDTEKRKKTWKLASKNPMATEDIIYCAEIGRARFDTKIVRNLTWFVQLQRVMRVVLTNHLSWINSPVVRGLKIADSSMTELRGNEEFDAKAFTGESYNGQI